MDAPARGPIEDTVLGLQATHRSSVVPAQPDIAPMRLYRDETWRRYIAITDARVCQYLLGAGFYGLAMLSYTQFDGHLITALVERWREETHTFHLPVGEATITLQDVEVLLGTPVDGFPVTDTGRNVASGEIGGMCLDLLGFIPGRFKGKRLYTVDLKEYMLDNPVHDDSEDVEVQRHTRCLILLLLGTFFPEKSSNLVSLAYLPLLRDLHTVGRYSWGSALLAFLYRALCDSSRIGVQSFGGSSLLVQVWAWTRLRHVRPVVRYHDVQPDPLGFPVGPRARWWTDAHLDLSTAPAHSVRHYRDQLDLMQPEQMDWEPYTDEMLGNLPLYCSFGRAVWMTCSPLIHFDIVELHAPDRVLRQFGMRQGIPAPIDTRAHLHTSNSSGGRVWSVRHAEWLAQWASRLDRLAPGVVDRTPLHAGSAYLRWYRRITLRFVGPVYHQPPDQGFRPLGGTIASLVQDMQTTLQTTVDRRLRHPPGSETYSHFSEMETSIQRWLSFLGQGDAAESDGGQSDEEMPFQHQPSPLHHPQPVYQPDPLYRPEVYRPEAPMEGTSYQAEYPSQTSLDYTAPGAFRPFTPQPDFDYAAPATQYTQATQAEYGSSSAAPGLYADLFDTFGMQPYVPAGDDYHPEHDPTAARAPRPTRSPYPQRERQPPRCGTGGHLRHGRRDDRH